MLEFYEKRKIKRALYSTPCLIVLGFVILALAIPAWGAYQKTSQTHEIRLAIAHQLRDLQERETSLQEEIDRLATDRGVEEEIRQKFEVGRSGEQMIVIVGEEKEEAVTEPEPETKGFFSRFTSWL